MLAQTRTGDGSADAEAAILGRNLVHGRDVLDIDHQVGLDMAGAQAHQQVGAAGQHAGKPFLGGQQANRVFYGCWGLVSHGHLLVDCLRGTCRFDECRDRAFIIRNPLRRQWL
jgi:hypothetical protein